MPVRGAAPQHLPFSSGSTAAVLVVRAVATTPSYWPANTSAAPTAVLGRHEDLVDHRHRTGGPAGEPGSSNRSGCVRSGRRPTRRPEPGHVVTTSSTTDTQCASGLLACKEKCRAEAAAMNPTSLAALAAGTGPRNADG